MNTFLKWGCLFLTSVCINAYAKPEPQSLDRIAAVVNDEVITESELNHATALVKLQMFQQKASIPKPSELKQQVITQLINKKLQLQLAKQAGISTSDTELNKAVEKIAQQNHMTVSELYSRLEQEGMKPADYRNEMRDQMTMHRIQQQEIINRIRINPQELQSFMNSNLWRDKHDQEYHLEDLLVSLPDNPSATQIEAAKKMAQQLINGYHQSGSLAAYLKTIPNQNSEISTGDLGWRKMGEIPAIFAEHLSSMHVKEIAGPIHAPNGFHIIRLTETRATDNANQTLTTKQAENLLLQRKFEQNIKGWLSRLKSTAYIVVNA